MKLKGFTLFEMLIVVIILGIIALALVPRLKDAQEYQKEILVLEKEMPKSYDFTTYVKFRSIMDKYNVDTVSLYNLMCVKDNKDTKNKESNSDEKYSTKERISDEACYQRFRVFESCENKINDEKDHNTLKDLLSLVENEQQANTIIEKCENYTQPNNNEKINKILDNL